MKIFITGPELNIHLDRDTTTVTLEKYSATGFEIP